MNKINDLYRFLAVIILVLTLVFLVQTAPAEEMTCTVPKGEFLYVRNRPSTEAEHLGLLYNGDTVEVGETNDGWVYFTCNGQNAYALADYFEVTDGNEYTITANGRVRYREKPNGTVSGFYSVGTVVVVDAWFTDKDGQEWGRIGSYYVVKEFLK